MINKDELAMKYIFLITYFIFFGYTVANAQILVTNDGQVIDQRQTKKSQTTVVQSPKKNSSSGFDISKLSIGGNLGLQFGDYTTINISPQVGYDFSEYITIGAGIGYTYFKEDFNNVDYKQSYLSMNIFGRFYPIQNIVIGIQPEISRMWQTIDSPNISYSDNKFVPSLLFGGGLRYNGVLAMIQYDVLQNKYTPYGDRLFYTVGYCFNF